MTDICISDIESAVNYWRQKKPSPDGLSLPAETCALADVYAMVVLNRYIQTEESSFLTDALAPDVVTATLSEQHRRSKSVCL